MSQIISRIAYLIVLLLLCAVGRAQTLVDDFEGGILDDWAFVQGNAAADDSLAVSGMHSVRLYKPSADGEDAQSLIVHRSFMASNGRYRVYCRADGMYSDIHFLFQYLDGGNYYAVACNPTDTDNPFLKLYKVVDGMSEDLASVPPTFGLDEWFALEVRRGCAGEIQVLINDQIMISELDTDLMNEGTIALGAWDESSYFDSLSFLSNPCEEITEIEAVVCSGRGYDFHGSVLFESGVYQDTLASLNGFDSIVQLNLTVALHYLVTEYDTICAPDVYLFGNDTIRSSGRYTQALFSRFGCDSIVELRLLVLGGDTLYLDSLICEGESVRFNDKDFGQEGIYYDSIFSDEGCMSLVALRLQLVRPSIDLGPDQTTCFEEGSITLSAPGFDRVKWSDGSTGASIEITTPGPYTVEAFLGTCMTSGSINFINECQPEEETSTFYMPNAFSPDGDLNNDDFKPIFLQQPASFRMRIFNRWGGLLFETEDHQQGWDGKVDGQTLDTGVYMYMMEVDGKVDAGTVTIVGST